MSWFPGAMGLAARLPVTLHLSADRHAHLRIEPGAMTRLFCAPAAQATKRGKPLTHPLACATDEGTNATPWQMEWSGVARQHLTHSSTHSRKRASSLPSASSTKRQWSRVTTSARGESSRAYNLSVATATQRSPLYAGAQTLQATERGLGIF